MTKVPVHYLIHYICNDPSRSDIYFNARVCRMMTMLSRFSDVDVHILELICLSP